MLLAKIKQHRNKKKLEKEICKVQSMVGDVEEFCDATQKLISNIKKAGLENEEIKESIENIQNSIAAMEQLNREFKEGNVNHAQ